MDVKKTTTTTTTLKKAVAKVPEVLLKKRKLYADLKARRLRSQVQATKVNLIFSHLKIHSPLLIE
jgi:hypothetical protein